MTHSFQSFARINKHFFFAVRTTEKSIAHDQFDRRHYEARNHVVEFVEDSTGINVIEFRHVDMERKR